jgi:hypothetical protein
MAHRLAGGAADDEPVGAVLCAPGEEFDEAGLVDRAVGIHRRHDRREDRS